MKELSKEQNELISRFERYSKVRTIYLWALIGLLVTVWIYYILRHLLLANPFYVMKELQKKTYPKDAFVIVAAFLPSIE